MVVDTAPSRPSGESVGWWWPQPGLAASSDYAACIDLLPTRLRARGSTHLIATDMAADLMRAIDTAFWRTGQEERVILTTETFPQFQFPELVNPLRVQYFVTLATPSFLLPWTHWLATTDWDVSLPPWSQLTFRLAPTSIAERTVDIEAPALPDMRRVLETLTKSLQLTHDDIEEITGISRTSLFNWKGGEMIPRPAKVAPLLRLYALARAILGYVDGPEAAAAWLRAGTPSPLSLLRKQKFEKVEDMVASLVFEDSDIGREPHSVFAPDEDFDAPLPSGQHRPSPARRVRRTEKTSAL